MYIGMRPHVYGHPEDMEQDKRKEIQMALRAKLIAEDGDLPKKLGHFEAMLKKSGTGWFVGPSPTIADCQVIGRCRHLSKGVLDGIPATILDDYPTVKDWYTRFHALPAV